MLSFLLAESALELVPKEIWNHPAVRSWCRRFGRTPATAILDASYMHSAMVGLKDRERRGRPDIVQLFLLTVLESPAGVSGLVDVYIHTRKGNMFYVEPGTRIPRAYTRFIGLFSQLLRGKDTPRIHPIPKDPIQIVQEKRKEGYTIVLMDEEGESVPLSSVLSRNTLVIVGGFPRGGFTRDYDPDYRVSLGPVSLSAHAVGCRVVSEWERLYMSAATNQR